MQRTANNFRVRQVSWLLYMPHKPKCTRNLTENSGAIRSIYYRTWRNRETPTRSSSCKRKLTNCRIILRWSTQKLTGLWSSKQQPMSFAAHTPIKSHRNLHQRNRMIRNCPLRMCRWTEIWSRIFWYFNRSLTLLKLTRHYFLRR